MLVGCIHLAPSAGTPGFRGEARSLAELEADLAALEGVDAILLENEHDKPHTLYANPEQAAWLERVSHHARARIQLPLGINVQRIDWETSFAVAAAAKLDFVRLDVLVDRVRMEGQEVALDAAAVMAAATTNVFADIHVKHAEHVDPMPIGESARRAAALGVAAVLVTGNRTGEPPLISDLRAARGHAPVYIGSGLTPANARELAPECDGAVVGTSLMTDKHVDRVRVAAMVEAWRSASRR